MSGDSIKYSSYHEATQYVNILKFFKSYSKKSDNVVLMGKLSLMQLSHVLYF